jgi:hypothetical protein
MSTVRTILLILLLFASAIPAAAGTIRIPLPDLVGNYTIDRFDGSFPAWGKQITVPTGISHFGSERATIELKGSVEYGKVRGDGIQRQNTDAVLDGGFGVSFQPTSDPLEINLGQTLLPDGEFQRSWSFSVLFQPGIDDFPVLGGEPRTFIPLSPSISAPVGAGSSTKSRS